MKWIAGLWMAFSSIAFSSDVCVRSYPQDTQNTPCVVHPKSYYWVVKVSKDPSTHPFICTRSYSAFYCDSDPKAYRWVKTQKEEWICTVHYDQPNVAHFCDDLPDLYEWAVGR